MFNSTSHSFAALTRELSISTLEENFHIYARPCIILYISDLLLIYYKNGPLILLWGENPSNNYFETKFKSRDTTQSPPEKKKTDILSTGILALAHSKWPAKEVEINQHLQNPQKKVTSDRTTSCIYLTSSSKNF